MSEQDIAEVVRVHLEAFPGFFLSELGPGFLRQFYRGFLCADGIALVAVEADAGKVCAATAGAMQPAWFFSRLLVQRWWAFGLAALPTLARRPSILPRLLRAIRYRGDAPSEPGGALWSTLQVRPGFHGRGIGRRLAKAFLQEAEQRGARYVYAFVDADNERTIRLHRSLGFKSAERLFTPEAREMVRLALRFGPPSPGQ
jgi:ribosomal protein S18 acetylase RimI-like enzyme